MKTIKALLKRTEEQLKFCLSCADSQDEIDHIELGLKTNADHKKTLEKYLNHSLSDVRTMPRNVLLVLSKSLSLYDASCSGWLRANKTIVGESSNRLVDISIDVQALNGISGFTVARAVITTAQLCQLQSDERFVITHESNSIDRVDCDYRLTITSDIDKASLEEVLLTVKVKCSGFKSPFLDNIASVEDDVPLFRKDTTELIEALTKQEYFADLLIAKKSLQEKVKEKEKDIRACDKDQSSAIEALKDDIESLNTKIDLITAEMSRYTPIVSEANQMTKLLCHPYY